jgi:hypothetical protein
VKIGTETEKSVSVPHSVPDSVPPESIDISTIQSIGTEGTEYIVKF